MKRTPRHTRLRTAAALTLLLPALTACTIVSRTVPAADEPITFASFLPDVTKAGVVESEADMTEFAVWGRHTDAAGATPTTIFNGERIYRDDTGATAPWTYNVPRFWVEGHYDFYALYPYPADGSGVTAEVTADGITSITLDSPNADIDLMTATASRDYSSANPDASAVGFTFDHLLSRVSIQAEAGAGDVQISSLTFSGMYVGGNCNPATASWDFTGRTADGSISLPESSGPIKVTPSEPVPVLPDLLMIPQTPGSSCGITLTWTLNGTEQDPVSLTVPADPAWTAARHYIYTLKLNDVVDVTLNINVLDWEEDNYSMNFNDWN